MDYVLIMLGPCQSVLEISRLFNFQMKVNFLIAQTVVTIRRVIMFE